MFPEASLKLYQDHKSNQRSRNRTLTIHWSKDNANAKYPSLAPLISISTELFCSWKDKKRHEALPGSQFEGFLMQNFVIPQPDALN